MTIASSRHFAKIVQDFVGNFDHAPVREFFAASPFASDERVREIIAARLTEQQRPERAGLRQAVVERIRHTHQAAEALTPAVERNLEQLASEETLAIVTGQQVGILAGPLYTLYKTLHTIILVREYARRFPEYHFIPVFWQETEDHDFPEVSSVGIINGEFQLKHVGYTPEASPDRKQVGAMPFEQEALGRFFEELREALPKTEFTDDVIALCERCYHPGVSFADAQSAMLCRLFADDGLLILNANTRELKRYASGIFEQELTSRPLLSDTLNAYSEPLKLHYHAQIDANGYNTFFVEDGKRFKLQPEADGYRYNDRLISQSDLLDKLREQPERFSMNVVLRPLVQDTILPTAAYVAGPGEIAYFAQLSGAYRWAGIQMPVIVPRISMTLVDDRFYKLAEKFSTSVESLIEFGPELVKELLKSEYEEEISESFERVTGAIENSIETLRGVVERSDTTLGGALTSLKGKIMTQVRDLGSKASAAERKKQQASRQQFEKALQVLLPENKLQEREINLVYFLNRYGTRFWAALKSDLLGSDRSLK